MKELIYSDEFYEFSVDVSKNRQYLSLRGDWNDASVAKDYLKHNRESLERLQPGFTSYVDLRETVLPPDDVLQQVLGIFVQATKEGEEAGMRKQAQIVKKDTKEEKVTARQVMKDSDYDQKMIQFTDPVEAEKWLDM